MVFVTTVILARLLSQDDFGVAGYALVVMSFLDVLNGFGVMAAVIYFKDDDGKIANTAFWIAQGMGILQGAAIWWMAPWAGTFFNDARVIPLVRLLAINFPITALRIVHDSLLQKELLFSRRFIPDLVLSTAKGVISIILALLGFGVWSLIIGYIIGNALSVLAFWMVMPWRPSFSIDRQFLKVLFSYGTRIVALEFLAIVLTESDYLIVGHSLGSIALGVYTMAFRIPDMLIVQFNYTISKVIFPAFTKVRENAAALEKTYLSTLRYVALITVPLGIGTAMVARPLVIVFLSEKWLDVYPVLQAISIYAMLLSLAHHNGDIYKALGRPSVEVWISMVRACVLVPALIWAVSFQQSIVAVGWVHVTVAGLTVLASMYVVTRMMNFSLRFIVEAFSPALLAGGFMTLMVGMVMVLLASYAAWIQLLGGIAVGIISYLGILWFIKRDVAVECYQLLVVSARGIQK